MNDTAKKKLFKKSISSGNMTERLKIKIGDIDVIQIKIFLKNLYYKLIQQISPGYLRNLAEFYQQIDKAKILLK